jgi:hypothetical protein
MGGKAKAPPPPNYGPLASAMEAQSKYAMEISKEQLDWAKQVYAENKGDMQAIMRQQIEMSDYALENAQKDRARYEDIYQPLEDNLVADAASFASGERRDLEMGRAQANVAQQFDAQRNAATRQLEGYGIDPSSTRFQALDIGYRAQKAATQAAAGNQASQLVDATGRALRSEAINVGRGYPGQVAGSYGAALQGGNSAAGNMNNFTATSANTMGTPTQWFSGAQQGLVNQGNVMNMGYQNQLAQFNANQQASSGWGSALGLAGGMLTSAFMMEDGGAVPVQASPTQGALTDDVPAALTPGEFVIPKDVTTWYGEKHMHSLIEKARKEQQEIPQRSGAIPQHSTNPPADMSQGPAFQSRSGALPTG